MYVGEVTNRQLISIALMILFTMALMFFLGYKYAYDKAVVYANEQIIELTKEFKVNLGLISGNPDFVLGNIELPDSEVEDEEE